MPLYTLSIEDGQGPAERVSQPLASPEQARAEAVVAASEMLRDADGRFWDAPEWRLRVTDEGGATVCVLTIAGAIRTPRPGRPSPAAA